MLLTTLLGGCSSILDWLPAEPDPEPTASEMAVLAGKIQPIFANLKLPGGPQVSPVHKTEAVSIANWVICLRNDAPGQMQYYAVFVKRADVVETRRAIVMDRCEEQSFTPLAPAPTKRVGLAIPAKP